MPPADDPLHTLCALVFRTTLELLAGIFHAFSSRGQEVQDLQGCSKHAWCECMHVWTHGSMLFEGLRLARELRRGQPDPQSICTYSTVCGMDFAHMSLHRKQPEVPSRHSFTPTTSSSKNCSCPCLRVSIGMRIWPRGPETHCVSMEACAFVFVNRQCMFARLCKFRSKDASGRVQVHGGPDLKESQHYPALFGRAVAELVVGHQASLVLPTVC